VTWQCVLLEPTDRARRALRRFTFSEAGTCPLHGTWGHDASVPIEDGTLQFTPEGYYKADSKDVPHDDSRWPNACACGYTFTADDHWQVSVFRLYEAPDGRAYTIHPGRDDRAPAGAMWRSDWLEPQMAGPDGISLTMMLPDGYEWAIDGPATSGGHWTRTGTPPHITARPSILSPGYHGWLTDGVLSDDLEGRSYP
jgi:hypothetical protein